MPAKTKAVKRAAPSDRPTLEWEKQSFKRYSARGLGGADLQVVRSGVPKFVNERWHPVVFGNRWATQESFEVVSDAMIAAERIALTYVDAVMKALAAMPIAQRYGGRR